MIPEIFKTLKNDYSRKTLLKDVIAGIIVGIIAIPLSIAIAIASGVKPEQGLYTAVIGGFLISFFGGSRVQIGGPTGAFIIIVYEIVQKYGYDGLAVAGMMGGVILIIFGVLKFGSVIKYMPYPVVVGFTAGIGVVIFTSQIKEFFGLVIAEKMSGVVDTFHISFRHIDTINYYSLGIGMASIIIIILFQKKVKKIPGPLVAIILSTIAVQIFNLPVETIGSRFGDVPNMLPMPHIPHTDFTQIKELLFPALTIALLAGIESLLSAVVADGMCGTKHDSNMELTAQGIANIASPLFLGVPVTGAIARTAASIKSGGRTPVAGIVHALTVLLVMIFFSRYARLIPMAALSGILMIVAYNMSEMDHFKKLLKTPKSDAAVLLITFFLTVFTDLTIAINFGVVLAAILFMKRMSDVADSRLLEHGSLHQDEEFSLSGISSEDVPENVEIFEISGPFFFGATWFFKDAISQLQMKPKVLIIRMRQVPAIDATGLNTLEWVNSLSRKDKTIVVLSGVQDQPWKSLEKSGLMDEIGRGNVHRDINSALKRAKEIISIHDDINDVLRHARDILNKKK
ncbi:MAG: sulfate permease [Spirochaetes bacterium]|nr:sulfate permease [Spirochaetota bacterium]